MLLIAFRLLIIISSISIIDVAVAVVAEVLPIPILLRGVAASVGSRVTSSLHSPLDLRKKGYS